MKTIFGFCSSAMAGATAQRIAAAANSGQTVVLNLRFTILCPFIRDSPDEPKPASMFAFSTRRPTKPRELSIACCLKMHPSKQTQQKTRQTRFGGESQEV